MNFEPAQQINAVRHIARAAQRRINDITGMRVSLLVANNENLYKSPEQMLKAIALGLGMDPKCYRMKTRLRHIAELRFLGALFLRRHFPNITLQQIAMLFGGQDHTSIISGLTRAYDLIYTGDMRFIKKYDTALKTVDIWLKKEV